MRRVPTIIAALFCVNAMNKGMFMFIKNASVPFILMIYFVLFYMIKVISQIGITLTKLRLIKQAGDTATVITLFPLLIVKTSSGTKVSINHVFTAKNRTVGTAGSYTMHRLNRLFFPITGALFLLRGMFYLLEFRVALLLCFIVIYTFLIYYFYEVVLVNVLSPYEYLMTVEDITQESFDVILDKGLEATQSKKFDKDILTYLCLYAVCFLDKNVVMPKAIMESMYDFITNQNKPLVHSFFVELLLVRLYGAMRQSDVPLILETQEMIIAYAETLDKRKKAKKPIFFIKRLRRDIERVKNQQLEDIKLNRDFRRFLKQRNLL